MKLFVIIAAVVACTCAAPTAELQHPSPVHPNVLVEVKPEEKIILITDPQELAKFKRETKQPLYPTVFPEQEHHITKREHKPGHEAKSQTKAPKAPTATKEPLQKSQAPNKPATNKRNRRDVESQQKSNNSKQVNAVEFQKPQILPVILPADEVEQETSESKNNRREEIPQFKDKEDDKNVAPEVYKKSQGLPAIFSPSIKANQQQKRDILTPLAPKYHHLEEYPKENNEKEIHEEKQKDEKTEHVTPGVLQKSQDLPVIPSLSNDADRHQKRDIPVSLVPKYHPEESSKDSNEKETQEGVNKEVKSENHNESFQKHQTLPLNLKETPDKTQHKRDVTVPKHHDPEESQKESDEKEAHKDKEEVNSESNHGTAQSQDHVNTEIFQKPQTLPLILKETHDDTQHKRDIPVPLVPKHHRSEQPSKENEQKETEDEVISKNNHLNEHNQDQIAEGIQKPQTLPFVIKESNEDKQYKREIPKHHHPEESPKDGNEKNSHEDTKDNSENHHVPQTLELYEREHVSTEHYQKPQTLPDTLKETNYDWHQHQKYDTLVPLVSKRESSKDNNSEKEKHEENKEELLENPYTPQIHHKQVLPASNHEQHTNFQKPQILPIHHEYSTHNNNEKSDYDIQTHHITQILPDFEKPQILPAHNREYNLSTGFQKSEDGHLSARDFTTKSQI